MLGILFCFLLSLADVIFFFHINFFKKELSGTLLVCQTFCIQIRGRSVRKLFAKVISRRQKSSLARKEIGLSLGDFPWPPCELNNCVF